MLHKVQITRLEMNSIEEFKPKKGFENGIEIKEIENTKHFNLMLFLQVGIPYRWYERLMWNDEQWDKFLKSGNGHLHLGFKGKAIIGYYELVNYAEKGVEIKYFGLTPENTGKGLGGYFLSHAIQSAWDLKANKVFLQTCNLDHPYAIENYKSRGFNVNKIEDVTEDIPAKEEFLRKISEYFEGYYSKE